MAHVVRREVLRREGLLLLIIVNFYLLYVTSIYFRCSSAEVGQKGDPFSNVAVVVVKPAEKGETGREQWRDPSSKII